MINSQERAIMYVNNDSYITQSRVFSGTGSIAGVRLPDFNDVHVFTQRKIGTSDSTYKERIVEQAKKDQAEGKFQNESNGFNILAKCYVSEISPDRKGIITEGLRKIEKNQIPINKPLDLVELLLNGKVKYQKDSKTVKYAEFYDSNGEKVAKYSNNGWTFLNTKEETKSQIEMCEIYNAAWNVAAKESKENIGNSMSLSVGSSENTFDMSV